MFIPQSVIESIKERQSLVELISGTVELKRAGSRMLGLCPFHSEKTPSFNVNEEEGFYHCFGCGAHGDVFKFVMESRNLSFPESVKFLAGKLGIALPKSDSRGDGEFRAEKRLRSLLRVLFVEVVSIYQEELKKSKPATDYLESRGLSLEIQEEFGLGYAPDNWDFLLGAIASKVSEGESVLPLEKEKLLELLMLSGLVKKKEEKESHYDAFRGRVIFPIFRSDAIPIALGGRTFSEAEDKPSGPKYINSTESLIYEKRKTLYGLPQAIKHCGKKRHLFLVEGYMDVLSLSQVGIKNVVASCGTALTPEHVGVIKRIADRVTLIFDGDEAGKKAGLSAFETFAGSGVEVTIVTPDKGEDPDSLAKKLGEKEVLAYFRERVKPVVEFYFDCYLGSESDSKSIKAATAGKLANSFVKIVAKVPNPVERDLLLSVGAKRLGASKESLLDLLEALLPKKNVTAKFQQKKYAKVDNAKVISGVEASQTLERIVGKKEEGSNIKALESFERQLAVAVVCSPRLADNIGSLDEVTKIGGSYGEKLSQFIKSVKELKLAGLGEGEGRFSELLERAGLGELGILEEAKRQLEVGGAKPEQVITEATEVVRLSELKDQVKRIRQAEGEAEAAGQLELAQEKLKRIRELEGMRSAKEN